MRTSKELLIATKVFAQEHRWKSWWYLWSTAALLVALLFVASSSFHLVLRTLASILAGLVCVRLFIIYHDHQHRAILRNSTIANCIMWVYGVLTLSPPSVWNHSHSHHHKHNSRTFGPVNVGSFPVMTKAGFLKASARERFGYLATRHPLTILFGYLTIFLWGMSLRPFIKHPGRHFDGGVAVLSHILLSATLGATLGITSLTLIVLLPLFVACLFGGYLFYAQHNFPAAKFRSGTEWSHVEAALSSSSYMRMGPVLNWLTGNIGFHHVHHMNALIPFYRLPEAMKALDELSEPGETSLSIGDIRACLALKLWDPDEDRFVGIEHTDTSHSQSSPAQMDRRAF